MALANLLAGRLSLDFPSALWIVPTWLPVWLLGALATLPLSGLVARGGSHLLGYVLLAGLLVANDRKAFLASHGVNWLARIVEAVLWPVNTLLAQASAGIYGRDYVLAWALTCAMPSCSLYWRHPYSMTKTCSGQNRSRQPAARSKVSDCGDFRLTAEINSSTSGTKG